MGIEASGYLSGPYLAPHFSERRSGCELISGRRGSPNPSRARTRERSLPPRLPPHHRGRSVIRREGRGHALYNTLRNDFGISALTTVAVHEGSGSSSFVVLQFKRTAEPSQVWKALETAGTQPWGLKWVVGISEGIDPWDADVVNWMICFGMQPHRDMRVVDAGQESPWDPS